MARKNVISFEVTGVKEALGVLKFENKRKFDQANGAIHKAGLFMQGEVKMSIAGRRGD
jgi:hypothetical protein